MRQEEPSVRRILRRCQLSAAESRGGENPTGVEADQALAAFEVRRMGELIP
jgi:hypothetical protein